METIELKQTHKLASCVLVGVLTSTCGAAPGNGGAASGNVSLADENRPTATTRTGNKLTNQDLPIHQRFATLDAYLAHLEQYQGPVDGPWYKEVSPGAYQLQTGNLRVLGASEEKRTFTRKELEKKFGFSK